MLDVEIGEPLPDADRAIIKDDKVRLYLLNPEHEVGGPKARVFRATLGFTQEHWRELAAVLHDGVQTCPVIKVQPGYDGGLECYVVIDVQGPNGAERPVMTQWHVPRDGSAPHLVTAYVKKR